MASFYRFTQLKMQSWPANGNGCCAVEGNSKSRTQCRSAKYVATAIKPDSKYPNVDSIHRRVFDRFNFAIP